MAKLRSPLNVYAILCRQVPAQSAKPESGVNRLALICGKSGTPDMVLQND